MPQKVIDVICPRTKPSRARFVAQSAVGLLIPQQFLDSSTECFFARLIDDQAAAISRDFAECAVAAANTRFAVQKAFGNGQAESFHQRWIDGEPAFAIRPMKCLVIDVFRPENGVADAAQSP